MALWWWFISSLLFCTAVAQCCSVNDSYFTYCLLCSSQSSSICRAAIHYGILDNKGGLVDITRKGRTPAFVKSTRNGVESFRYYLCEKSVHICFKYMQMFSHLFLLIHRHSDSSNFSMLIFLIHIFSCFAGKVNLQMHSWFPKSQVSFKFVKLRRNHIYYSFMRWLKIPLHAVLFLILCDHVQWLRTMGLETT